LYLSRLQKAPELRRPEQELEKSCKAVAVSFLGLVLFNFVVFRSEVFSRYLLVSWFTLTTVLLVAMRFTLRAFYESFGRPVCAGGEPCSLVLYRASEYQQLLSISAIMGTTCGRFDGSRRRQLTAVVPDLPVSVLWINGGVALRHGSNVLIVMNPAVRGEEWIGQSCAGASNARGCRTLSGVLATANMNYEHDEFSGCFRFHAQPRWSLACNVR